MVRTLPEADLVAPPSRTRIDSRRRWLPNLRGLFESRHLVVLLGRRDVTVKYRQTVLGAAWVFLGALVSAGLFTFVFGRVADLPSQGVPYFVFSYAGLLAWNLFTGTLSSASGSVNASAGLITKIYFPRLVVVASSIAGTLVNLVISSGIMLVLLFISGVGISVQILLTPVWLFAAALLAMGLALTLTSVAVWYRDVNYFTALATQLLLFLSPVAYSIQAVPKNLQNWYLLNPLTTIVEGARWSLLGTSYLPPAWAMVYTAVLTLVVLLMGLVVFARLEGGFADVI
jgi:lipopolysaccharide transport system permease protein